MLVPGVRRGIVIGGGVALIAGRDALPEDGDLQVLERVHEDGEAEDGEADAQEALGISQEHCV